MAKIVWTDEALAWLKGISDYLSERSLRAAAQVTEGIYEKAQLLQLNPKIGFRVTDYEDREVRELLYGHYRIIYELRGDGAFILAVIHAALDIERLQLQF